ncbi:MAG: hypothetical protein ACPGUV_04035 [Polyangiales bacterium]
MSRAVQHRRRLGSVQSCAAALFAGWLFAGCQFSDEARAGVLNQCERDADCSGARCHPELLICVSEQSDVMRLAIEVTPASSDSARVPDSFTFTTVELSEPTQLDLQMPEAVTIIGTVRWLSQPSEVVQAELTLKNRVLPVDIASAPGLVRNQGVQTTSRAGVRPADSASGEADYALRTINAVRYEVEVLPQGDDERLLPPARFRDVVIDAPEGSARFDIRYEADLVAFSGRVFGTADGGAPVPEDGLRVRAVRREDGEVISSTDISGGAGREAGAFFIRLDPSWTTCDDCFVIEFSAAGDRPLFPTVWVDPRTFLAGVGTPSVQVPKVSPVQLAGQALAAENGRPLGGAVLSFTSDNVLNMKSGLIGKFQVQTLSDAEGRFSVELLPGDYDVVMTPEQSDNAAVHVVRHTVGPVSSQLTLQARERVSFGGEVRTWDGRRVPAAAVVATAQRQGPLSELTAAAVFGRSQEGTTTADGNFALALDEGGYDLQLRPAQGSGLPWVVVSSLPITAATPPIATRYIVPPPLPLFGRVLRADGAPLRGAELVAYRLPADDEGDAVAVARAVSDTDGHYRLLFAPLGR